MKFRKRPVVVEAYKVGRVIVFDEPDVPQWLRNARNQQPNSDGAVQPCSDPSFVCEIITLEGVHLVSPGDWIIRGVAGELYPCKPGIFEATYERVEE